MIFNQPYPTGILISNGIVYAFISPRTTISKRKTRAADSFLRTPDQSVSQSRINHVERARLSWVNDFEETSNHITTRDSVQIEIKQFIIIYTFIIVTQFSIYYTCDTIIFYAITYKLIMLFLYRGKNIHIKLFKTIY